MFLRFFGLFAVLFFLSKVVVAQYFKPGELDTTFNFGKPHSFFSNPANPQPGEGANSLVYSLALQPDGKVMIAGNFTGYNGAPRNFIARLNADGSLDASFNPGTGSDGAILTLGLQPDGKVVIGGSFTSYNGTTRNHIARLNVDGSLDAGFNPGTGANGTVLAFGIQPDGKLLIGGGFTSFNGTTSNHIARLNADGSLDASFNPNSGVGGSFPFVRSLALQPDGKVFIGGRFTSYNGTARNRIARLNADGSLDTSFNPGSAVGTEPSEKIESLALQPDGRLLIGGEFTTYNGTIRKGIARLNADGSLDAGFNTGDGANGSVRSLALQPDGKVLIGGVFNSYNGTLRNNIARLNADGSLDAGFNPGTGASGYVFSLALQPNGRLLVGGDFTNYNGTYLNRIARLNADGSHDASFNPGTGASSRIFSLALQPDGKAIIGGSFTSYNGVPRNFVARLNADGSLDTSFGPGTGANNTVWSFALQPDGKVFTGGAFTSYNDSLRSGIARLNADGSLDITFNPGTGANGAVRPLALQPDGKLLIGGTFTSYNGTSRSGIARLNADGSLDAGFNPGTGANGSVRSLILQSDGKVLIGGDFTSYNGTPRNRIARLNADGSLDAGFNPGTGANDRVNTLALQTDGKVVIGGDFTSYNTTPLNFIARLNADGSLDEGFNPGTGANNSDIYLALQPDGKVLVGGSFQTYNGTPRNGIARLNADGSLDTSFDPGTGLGGSFPVVGAFALQPDSKLLIGGDFTSFNGTYRSRIARVLSTVDCAHVPKISWTGMVSSDWHTAGNWSTGYVPTGATHVIIGPSSNICVIGAANAEAYSVQVRNGGRLEQRNGYQLMLLGTCTQLPPP